MTTLRLLPDLEASLRQLPDVRAVSVVTGPDARPTEVHVLAGASKPAKQLVRDVQSMALAQHGIDIDHRIVSVVQLADEPGVVAVPTSVEPGRAADGPGEELRRPAVSTIAVRTGAGECEVEVVLRCGEDAFTGRASGAPGPSHRASVVARATLAAVSDLLGLPCELDSSQVVRTPHRDVALTVLSMALPRAGELVVTGSAPVRSDEAEAVARSVLDALNRQLTG